VLLEGGGVTRRRGDGRISSEEGEISIRENIGYKI
jgi:hypothetical protein